jgi:hypothetical protein
VTEEQDALKNVIHVGYSTGGGKVARHIARHGENLVSKAKVRDNAL